MENVCLLQSVQELWIAEVKQDEYQAWVKVQL